MKGGALEKISRGPKEASRCAAQCQQLTMERANDQVPTGTGRQFFRAVPGGDTTQSLVGFIYALAARGRSEVLCTIVRGAVAFSYARAARMYWQIIQTKNSNKLIFHITYIIKNKHHCNRFMGDFFMDRKKIKLKIRDLENLQCHMSCIFCMYCMV